MRYYLLLMRYYLLLTMNEEVREPAEEPTVADRLEQLRAEVAEVQAY